MNPDQRQQVVENAKYLRNVRPVDPDEIYEYVEGQPHPATVKRVLREEAFELGLAERPDGTFEPVADGPLEPTCAGVEAFPEQYARRLEDLLVERFGADWHRGDSGDRLREEIRRLKEDYYHGNPVEYDETTALAYAIYHLPDNYAVIQYVLDELGRQGLLPGKLRVLDVGAGVGGPTLGLHDYVGEDALVEYHAVEPSAAADVLEAMLAGTGRNFHASVYRETAEAFDPDGEYDLLLFANVLSELEDPESVVDRYREYLAHDGALVGVAPADLETSTGLRSVERSFDDEFAVFSPTLRLWPAESPADRGWSLVVRRDLAVPPFQRKLDDGDGEFVNVDVQYSHFLLRPDGRRRLDVRADPDRHAKMAEMDDHVTERVDLLAVKLSHDLAEGEGNPVFKVSDGSERTGQFAVLAKLTALNRTLGTADYGDVVVFENVLVLWNDDEEAYNLVVDDETVVDEVPAP
ncbi:SAM-dependent methyltransferase [Halobacteriales archaeon QS_1_68_20]|nr:MAG: SAM-dependent methyltransferase [Halobacteriales archaeon QS_1_68_20]